jgi:hypothetical protein
VIVGNEVFEGAAGAATTTADGADEADPEPTEFEAVTATTNVDPLSAATAVYDCPVAPAMSPQFAPPLSHRRH